MITLGLCCITALSLTGQGFTLGNEYNRTRAGSLAAQPGSVSPGGETTILEYFISPGDKLEVFVWQNADLSKDVIVAPDGYVSYPLIGRIKAAGRGLGEVEKEMQDKLTAYVKYPQVSVGVLEFAGNRIIVLGEVNYPGIYTYKGTINLIEAVALAGDFTDKAHIDSVILVRGNLTKTPKATRINMAKVITRGTSDTDIVLQPNDVLYVPRTFIANVNKCMSDLSTILKNASTGYDVKYKIQGKYF
jgi:polysaccharide export outer membrane protein